MTDQTPAGGESDSQRRLRRMIELRSLHRVSDELDVSREALARYLARLDLQAGTRELIERKLAELAELDAAAAEYVEDMATAEPRAGGR